MAQTGLSSKGEITVLNSLTGGGTPNSWVSLHTGDPLDTGAAEVSGSAYARQGPVAFTNAGANATVASNSAIVTFPAATGAWGTVVYFGLWDAATAGNFRGAGTLTTSKAVNTGDTARFVAGALTITAQ